MAPTSSAGRARMAWGKCESREVRRDLRPPPLGGLRGDEEVALGGAGWGRGNMPRTWRGIKGFIFSRVKPYPHRYPQRARGGGGAICLAFGDGEADVDAREAGLQVEKERNHPLARPLSMKVAHEGAERRGLRVGRAGCLEDGVEAQSEQEPW